MKPSVYARSQQQKEYNNTSVVRNNIVCQTRPIFLDGGNWGQGIGKGQADFVNMHDLLTNQIH